MQSTNRARFRLLTRSLLMTVSVVLFFACKRTPDDPPPLPDTTVVAPPPPMTVATLTPLPGQPPTAVPTAVFTTVKPPTATATATATTPPTTTVAPPVGTSLPVPFTPYQIKIPAIIPVPIPVTIPSTLPFPVLPPFGTATTTPPPATQTTSTAIPPIVQPPVASSERVIVYGTNWCGPCKQLRADLPVRQVPFVFVDVEDPQAMKSPAGVRAVEMPGNMRNGVPVTRVVRKEGGVEWVQGAAGDRIERLYKGKLIKLLR